ncbi:MAG TPA: neutral zinc metallopeptidase [Thermoanaerobaculia bacterium]|nr:neutral zinc metallopeptidase [Thermoanaerobaculia bacterium]
MRWTPGGVSSDVEDRRGSSGGGGFGFGGMHIGIGGAVILLVLSLVFHKNFFALLGGGDTATTQQQSGPVQETPEEHRNVQFVSFVLDDAQKTWEQTLPGYRHAKLDLFRDAIQSACGFAQSASGPFYCPNDERVYIDLGFYDELRQKFGAPGDFAQAYVIAHEIGHHVQKLQGIEQQVHQAMENGSRSEQSALSVRLELQADCYAGVWGHSTQQRGIIDNADIEQGLNAAAAIGDDRLQRMAGRTVNPERFTHGSSQQRVEWFQRGLKSGRVEDCDTFR